MNGTNGLQLIGPTRRPDVAYRIARERAVHQERAQHRPTHTRANQSTGYRAAEPQLCHYCESGLYQGIPAGPCPACGNQPPQNNGRILEVRSAMRCAVCGVPYKDCWHGYQAQGR
jgi:hypothetical protein